MKRADLQGFIDVVNRSPDSLSTSSSSARSSRGRWLVFALLLFGTAATAGISTYWKVRLGPYAPYRRALKSAFPDGAPVVEGGNLPEAARVLRVVLKVAFTPVDGDERVVATTEQVRRIARDLDAAEQYDTLLLYLVRPVPEKKPERLEIQQPLHADPGGS